MEVAACYFRENQTKFSEAVFLAWFYGYFKFAGRRSQGRLA
jgi:hypothetical protein